jgi:hypothetical protein
MNKIEETLLKRFENHRVIFWYDEKQELTELYQEVSLDGVEKIEVNNNEFEVKHIINKQKPDSKLLVYIPHPKPANEDNWLLDAELAHHVFYTNQEALMLQEMGLDYHLKELVSEHIEFFKSKERRARLVDLLGVGDEREEIRAKMLAVVFNTEYVDLVAFIHSHAGSLVRDDDRTDRELVKFKLNNFYWDKIRLHFGYQSDNPSIYDFLLEVFNTNFALINNGKVNKETRLLLSQWKDRIRYRDSFGKLSERIAKDMDVESKLNKASIDASFRMICFV